MIIEDVVRFAAVKALAQAGVDPVSALHVHGGQPLGERRRALGSLRGAHHDDGDLVRVVCNARVLTEGVDAPAVDAVAFIDPRDSMIDIVQGIGRALRTGGRTGKIARIIVPVLLGPEEDPQSALDGSAYAQVWRVIRALRAVDGRLAVRLDAARQRLGQTRADAQADADGAGDHAGDDEQGHRLELWDWLKVSGVPVPEQFARAIQVRAVRGASPSWMELYGLAKAHYQAHGNLQITVDHQTPDGTKLGLWVRHQRRHRVRLDPRQIELLEEIGLEWDSPIDRGWRKGIAAARAFAAAHDNSLRDVPTSWSHDGVRLGRWLTLRRREFRDGKLADRWRAELDAIDPTWHLSSDEIWERHYNAARAFHHQHGHLRLDPDYRTPEGVDLPRWLGVQRRLRTGGFLTREREERLAAIDMPWALKEEDWRRGLAIARRYAAEHGDLNVPGNRDYEGFPLGKWLNNHRKQVGTGRLRPERMQALNALDPAWHTHRSPQARWDSRYQAARAYAEEHGHLPRRGSPAPEGPDFRKWLTQQRQDARRGLLAADCIAKLDALDPTWRIDARANQKRTPNR